MPVEHLDAPTPEAARDAVLGAIGAERMVTVVGRCEVEYEGRASSYLGPGDRLLVLKPDGTLLVHTSEQRTPVNWQPPGCAHAASVEDGRFQVRSVRSAPAETIEVSFESVSFVTTFEMEDTRELELSGTEADLRERILENPSLVEEGFEPVETEYRTDFGAVDVYGRDRTGCPVVVELKRRRVGPEAASQLARYVGAVDDGEGTPRGILVAPSITDAARALLEDRGLEFVSLEPES